MAHWLFKTEPDCYSFTDLERDGSTLWDGVTNALARKNLRQVQPDDRVWYYHTGGEKAVVGEARVVGGPQPDPTAEGDKNGVAVTVRPVRRLAHPVTLARIKADKLLAGWELVRLPRLSVVPVTPEQWSRVEELAQAEG